MKRGVRSPAARIVPLLLLLSVGPAPSADRIAANDNRRAAGTLGGDTLALALELRSGRWYPDADDGPSVTVQALGEAGGPLQIPSPLIRVSEGTVLRITLRNTLTDSTLIVHGLHSRPAAGDDTVQVAPGTTRVLRFPAGRPGTYHYWGTTTGRRAVDDRLDDDSQIGGAFIVDPRGSPSPDRIFVISNWFRDGDSTVTPRREPQDIMVINGKAWPHTETLNPTLGDSVRWRWINSSANSHPMHLHGFYFTIESRGDGRRDTAYAPAMRPLAVTELMLPGGTMSMRWAPTRPGNWIFHCHFAFHVSPFVSLAGTAEAMADSAGLTGHAHAMAGLVMGIHVAPAPGATMAAGPADARRIRLLVQTRPHRFGNAPGYGFVIQQGETAPPRDSIAIPGPTLALERGRPVRVTVVNNLTEPTGVHWHGIELESRADGVPGWSGLGSSVMQPIAPGDSFVAEFTPPRAGTFMYHAHANELLQLTAGLYAPLIVTQPGTPMDPNDRIVLVSLNGPSGGTSGGLVNGSATPPPIELTGGTRHRLRLINIDADERILFTLARDTTPLTWRALAKDGAELPPAQATRRAARLLTGPGETADFEVRLPRGDSVSLVISAPYTQRPWTMRVPVRAR
jgi:FtsP/CotA-like multicopper oxidase with cupredoxin domain